MKNKATKFDTLILMVLIVIAFACTQINADSRHQELMQSQEDLSTHIHYMDSVHYSNCSFTPNEKFKPFTP